MVAAVETISESRTNGRLDPDAAAHTRLGGGTGFRWIEEAVLASGSSLHPNINAANTYQFVMGNPVGRVDASGELPPVGLDFNFTWAPGDGLQPTAGWEQKDVLFEDPVTGTTVAALAGVEIEGTNFTRSECHASQLLENVFHTTTFLRLFPEILSKVVDGVKEAA